MRIPPAPMQAVAAGCRRLGRPFSVRGRNREARRERMTVEELVAQHFATHSDPSHINVKSMGIALELLNAAPAVILETGSSAWGTNSSRLFGAYVESFGGSFYTVDVRLQPLLSLRRDLGRRCRITCDDSVSYLRRWAQRHPGVQADLVYLDSWDLDVADPEPAARHGLAEFNAIRPALGPGSLLLIDDTPSDLGQIHGDESAAAAFRAETGLVPGKGMLILEELAASESAIKLHHDYQVLFRFL